MEENNRAARLLNQMKKYRHSDDGNADAEIREQSELVSPAIDEGADVAATPLKKAEGKKAVRRLPTEESLFEFDEVVFDDIVTDKPELTPEEEKYAEALSEKFGFSTNVGIGFLDDSPAKEIEDKAPPVNAVGKQLDEEASAEELPEPDEAEADSFFENAEASHETADEALDEPFVAPAAEEFFADEPVPQAEESEAQDISYSTHDPHQVSFGGPEVTAAEEEKPSAPITPTGIQITFLDAAADPESYEEAEQLSLDGLDSKYEDENDNTDAEDEPAFDGNEFGIVEDGELAEIDTYIASDVDSEGGNVDISIAQDMPNEAPAEEQLDKTEEEPFIEPITINIDETGKADTAEPAQPDTLTPIELAAIEEAERTASEAKAKEAMTVKQESPATDIWDEDSVAEYAEKKRFADFCNRLSIPPMKTAKEPIYAEALIMPQSSGYKEETTERLPLFADGMDGGRNTDSYISREIAYCAERESRRSAKLLDRLRSASRRLICLFAVMLTVLLIENLGIFFGGNPDSLLKTEHYMTFGIAVAVLLTVGAFMIFDVIRDGVKYAIRGVFIPETLATFVVIPSIIYHYVIAFCAPQSKYSMLFGTGCAAVMFLAGLYRYNMQKRGQITFSVTSSYGDYLTEVKMSGFKNSPEGRAFDGYADSEASLYKLNRVSRIDAPFEDNTVCDECFGLVRVIALCIIGAAVVAGVVFGFIRRDVVCGIVSAISLITYACPSGVFIALSIPRLRAATVSAEMGGAIVDFDDESDEFDNAVIMIDEEELFPAERLASCDFNFQYSPLIENHIARTRALFKKLGGSLAAMFDEVEGADRNYESISITEIADDGISAKVDGTPICVGLESYMKRLGHKIKSGDKLLPKTGRYIYVVDNGEFAARAMLIFKADEEMVRKISELRNTDTLFSLKTCNPCIDEDLLFHATGLEPELLRLVKYKTDDSIVQSKTDREGSLVSRSGALGLLTALLEYKRQKKLIYEASRFACISAAAGAVVSVITSAKGVNFGFSSLIVLATHGIMALAAFLMSRAGAINTKGKIKKK